MRDDSRYRIAIVICSFVGATVYVPSLAYACSYGLRLPPQLFDEATDVFVGKVIAGRYVRDQAGNVTPAAKPSGVVARFAVVTRYKGALASEMTIETDGGTGGCGFAWVVGDTYVVFGVVVDGRLATGQDWMPVNITAPNGSFPPDESSPWRPWPTWSRSRARTD